MPVTDRASTTTTPRSRDNVAVRHLVHDLHSLAGTFSVKFEGEDDNGDANFMHHKGKAGPLTAEKFLDAARYAHPRKTEKGDEFSFSRVKTDEDWDDIISAQDDPAVGQKLRDLLKGLDVGVATVNDPRPFGARGYLVASNRAGDYFVFRGIVGGMGF
jgi:hypothetical protein